MALAHGKRLGLVIPAALTTMFIVTTAFAGSTTDARQRTTLLSSSAPLTIIEGRSAAPLALGTSKRFFQRAPVVVIAAANDDKAQQLAVDASTRLQAPVLIDGPGIGAELRRLKAEQVLVIGAAPSITLHSRMTVEPTAKAVDKAVKTVIGGAVFAIPTKPTGNTLVVSRSIRRDAVALATARNAGATIIDIPGGDPRRVPAAATLLKQSKDAPVVALGTSFRRQFAYTLAVVRTAPEQLGGGYFVFPGRVLAALYGHPGTGSLGVLGETGVEASIARAKRTAKHYQKFTKKPVIPTFEIIATIASASAGKDKDYSSVTPVATLRPWVQAAQRAGVYVVLDLQSGRSDFLSQAKRYASLLKMPNVGLALDPEWRLTKHQKPLRQIGSVRIAEINRTSAWLAELTRTHALPQKLLVLHQFQTRMIRGRGQLINNRPELSILIHVDGQGSQPDKRSTWRAIHKGAPKGVFWGWKNFYDEDEPMLSPKKTWSEVRPRPEFISYQ